jgi:hypothetical protein
MSRTTIRLNFILFLLFAALISIVAITGCSPSQSSSPAGENKAAETTPVAAGAYVSDEQCMSCHGDSYETVAELTADLGDWNPHDSLHGGYNSCVNCHEEDKVISYNYCSQCHAYAPDEEVLY